MLNKTRAMRLLQGSVVENLVCKTMLWYPQDKPINNDHARFRNDRSVVKFD